MEMMKHKKGTKSEIVPICHAKMKIDGLLLFQAAAHLLPAWCVLFYGPWETDTKEGKERLIIKQNRSKMNVHWTRVRDGPDKITNDLTGWRYWE